MRTSEAEFRRVVRHEAGHTLGFDHEHMRSDIVKRIDREKAIAFFDRTEGWTPRGSRGAGADAAGEEIDHGHHRERPAVDHVLPAARRDHEGPQGGARRQRHQRARTSPSRRRSIRRNSADAGEPAAPLVTLARPAGRTEEEIDTFHLVVMDEFRPDAPGPRRNVGRSPKFAQVLASYGGARVTSTHAAARGQGRGSRRASARSSACTSGSRPTRTASRARCPSDDEMIAFGGELFETLFQGDVRRLYDEARTRQRRRRLDFVLTSMIPWISEKPWEFAYDTGRAELPRHRGDPLRPQRADERAGRSRSCGRRARCASWWRRRSRSASGGCRSTRKSRSSGAASSRWSTRAWSPSTCSPRATPEQIHGYLSRGQPTRSCTSSGTACTTRSAARAAWSSRTSGAASTCSASARCARSSASAGSAWCS